MQKFWQRQMQQLDEFKEKHPAFYEYYRSGNSENDTQWFVRINSDGSNFAEYKQYDMGGVSGSTSHDHLVGSLLALEKYHAYAAAELGKLKTGRFNRNSRYPGTNGRS